MEVKPGTCLDEKADMIWESNSGAYGKCFVLKIGDKFQVLKKYFNSSGQKIEKVFEEMEGFQIPLAPKYFDTSVKHPGEPFDWVLMDYIPGVTLERLLRDHKRIRLLYIIEIITALNLQLKKMGKKGIKHHDLKPGNIVIDANFIPHILDWDDMTTRISMTQSPYHGTIRFAAPEIFEMKRECASDIFSFGSIIFNMLTGKAPFDDVYNNLDGIFQFIPKEYHVEEVDEQEDDEDEQEDDENKQKDKEKKLKRLIQKTKRGVNYYLKRNEELEDLISEHPNEGHLALNIFNTYNDDTKASMHLYVMNLAEQHTKEKIRQQIEEYRSLDETTQKILSMKIDLDQCYGELIRNNIEPILIELIKIGVRDEDLIYDKEFLEHEHDKALANIISNCWKQEPKDRWTPKQIQKEIDNIVQYLTDTEKKKYEDYCAKIYDLEQKEYGTVEMINKAREKGFYYCDYTLGDIIYYLDNSFDFDRITLDKFYDFINTRTVAC